MPWKLSQIVMLLLLMCAGGFSNTCLAAGQQAELSLDELKILSSALIDLREAQQVNAELAKQLDLSTRQLDLVFDRVELERLAHLSTKKLHLEALLTLQAYRTHRRAMAIKILTLGIVRDKHDPYIDEEIKALRAEIAEWVIR